MAQFETTRLAQAGRFFAVAWSLFVAAFLYYVVLTILAIDGADTSDSFMAVAYGLPVVAYTVLLLARLAGVLAQGLQHLTQKPHAISR